MSGLPVMKYGGKYYNYLLVCPRKLWLYAGGLGMEHASERVAEGTLLHETSYPSRSIRYEELEVGPVKIDFYDARERVIHEVKMSDRMEEAHVWQVKYYQSVLERIGVEGVTAVLEYPAFRHTEHLGALTDEDRGKLEAMEKEIDRIVQADVCPAVPAGRKGICRKCSYFDFCFVGEMSDDGRGHEL